MKNFNSSFVSCKEHVFSGVIGYRPVAGVQKLGSLTGDKKVC